MGFVIKSRLVKKLRSLPTRSLPKGISDRLMTMQIPLGNNQHATLISSYAPTMTNPEEKKDKLYDGFDAAIRNVPGPNKLIILGYFNARVGSNHKTWEEIIGKIGIGKRNSNGLLLRACSTHDLTITNTLFKLPKATEDIVDASKVQTSTTLLPGGLIDKMCG
jgi:hypothetical protein